MAEQFSPEYISGLKQKFDHIQAEARKEVRRKKREEVGEVKKRMYDKLEVLSDKISALYSAVYHEPDKLTLETAQGFVLNDSKPYLTEGEAKSLRTAIERYHEKRKAVKEFIKSTRSQEEAFFLCFGFYPTGKMEVISGPMTLTFRLYDFEDFKKAYLTAYVKSGKDEIKKISDQAEGVGGVAMRDSGVRGLEGCLILENASRNKKTQKKFEKKTVTISGLEKSRVQEYFYPRGIDSNLMIFNISGLGEVEVHLERDEREDVRLVSIYSQNEQWSADPVKGPHHVTIEIPTSQFKKPEQVEFEFYPKNFTVRCHTKGDLSFYFPVFKSVETVLADKDFSKRLRKHEEQHQFNNLFYPEKDVSAILEWQKKLNNLESRLEKHPEKKPKEVLCMYLGEKLREYYIDCMSRDEILAKLKGGSSLDQIKESMLTLSAYNYKSFESASGITYTDMISLKAFTALVDLLRDGETAIRLSTDEFIFLRTKLRETVDLSNYNEVRKKTEFVLGDLYKKKFFQWLDAVAKLEKSGLGRQEIVSYLGLLPINSWKNAVRRKLMREGKYERPKTLNAHA
jgi:hypothetical protein